MIKLKLSSNTESLSRRITDIYIYLMLLFFPLFTGFRGYSDVTLSKYLFFVSVTALWLIALLVIEVIRRAELGVNKLTLVGVLILIYFVFCCISAIFSSFRASVLLGEGRFDGLITTFLCVGIFFCVSQFAHPKKAYIYTACLAVSLNCIVAVLQILGYNPLHLFPGTYNFYDAGMEFSSTFLGTIGNADLFSAYICLILPLASIYYISAKRRPLALMYFVLLTAFCLFKSGVAGGLLALAVTAVVASPFIITNGERLRRALEIAFLLSISAFLAFSIKITEGASGVTVNFLLSRFSEVLIIAAVLLVLLRLILNKSDFAQTTLKIIFAGLATVAIVSGLLTAYYWKGSEGSIYELSQILHGNIKDSFGSSRILIWRKSLKLVPESLLLGGGPGTLALRLDVSFSRFVAETGKTLSSSVDNTHNYYLGILVNTGLLSLVAYIAAQGISLFKAVKAVKLSEFCGALACCLLCYWVQDFFGLGLFLVSPLMWLFWGLLVSSLRRKAIDSIV